MRRDEVAYLGDDLIDLPILRQVGLAGAVADASPEVKEAAHWQAKAPGGRGAVREFMEFLLKAQGRWQEIIHDEQPHTFLFVPEDSAAYDKRFQGVAWLPPRPGYDLNSWFVPKGSQKYTATQTP